MAFKKMMKKKMISITGGQKSWIHLTEFMVLLKSIEHI